MATLTDIPHVGPVDVHGFHAHRFVEERSGEDRAWLESLSTHETPTALLPSGRHCIGPALIPSLVLDTRTFVRRLLLDIPGVALRVSVAGGDAATAGHSSQRYAPDRSVGSVVRATRSTHRR